MIAIGGRVTPTPRNERVSTARSCTGRRLGRGFIVQPRRWVVERTNGWDQPMPPPGPPLRNTLDAHERFLIFSQITLLRRLDRTQLLDTLGRD
jgi:hypothetical protein